MSFKWISLDDVICMLMKLLETRRFASAKTFAKVLICKGDQ